MSENKTFQHLQRHINMQHFNNDDNNKHYLYLNNKHLDKYMLREEIKPVLERLNKGYELTVRNVSPFDNNPSYNKERRPAKGPRVIIAR